MSVITISKPDISKNISTYLSEDYVSGTSLTVESSTSLINGNYVIIGEPGLEKSEITNLTATPPTDTSLTVSALNFSHPKGTSIYYTRWDKYSLDYRTTDAGAWTAYGSMPATLTWDSQDTEYTDTAATSTYSWRYRYYSTESSTYSDYSDTISFTGWNKNTVGFMIADVRKIANDPNGYTVSDKELIHYFNAAQDKIYALYDRWWFLLKVGTAIDTVASTIQYSLPSDFGRMHSVNFNYVNGSSDITYPLRYISKAEFDYEARDNNASADDNVIHYTLMPGDSSNTSGYIKVYPKPETAGLDIIPYYYKTITSLDSFGDTTEIPIPAMLEDYALAQIFKIREKEDIASYYDKIFREQIDLLKLMQRKQVGPPRQLWRWQGRNALNRLYGNKGIYSDADVEKYF